VSPLQAAATSAGAWLLRGVRMPDNVYVETVGRPDRRRFLVRCMLALHAGIASTLSFILGSAILSPSFRVQSRSWLRAASFDDVPDDDPLAVTLRLVRQDGLVQ
jgi:hypothetical protein